MPDNQICISKKAYCIVQLVKPHAEGLDIEELLTNLEADKYDDILKNIKPKQRRLWSNSGYPALDATLERDGKGVGHALKKFTIKFEKINKQANHNFMHMKGFGETDSFAS